MLERTNEDTNGVKFDAHLFPVFKVGFDFNLWLSVSITACTQYMKYEKMLQRESAFFLCIEEAIKIADNDCLCAGD